MKTRNGMLRKITHRQGHEEVAEEARPSPASKSEPEMQRLVNYRWKSPAPEESE